MEVSYGRLITNRPVNPIEWPSARRIKLYHILRTNAIQSFGFYARVSLIHPTVMALLDAASNGALQIPF